MSLQIDKQIDLAKRNLREAIDSNNAKKTLKYVKILKTLDRYKYEEYNTFKSDSD